MESSMEYTSDGRQIRQITDVRGAQTTFTYDDDNRLLKKVTDPKGTETTYEYDPNTDQMTRVIRKTDQGNREIVYTYDGDKIQSIQRNGMEYGYEYDAYGNQTAVKIAGVRAIFHNFFSFARYKAVTEANDAAVCPDGNE